MRARHLQQFSAGLRKRYVKNPFPATHSLEQELQCQGRFTRTRVALNQIKTITRQTAAQNVVQPLYPAATTFIIQDNGGACVRSILFHGSAGATPRCFYEPRSQETPA